ncbi:hypothetical protein [Gemmobacter sp. 24YEA27]|uniref:hypothetical protein n=1 Tax=Gemmobacter sp. 24YEA27 TaxID=3040672 RepID=UPI0024B369AF|nr:hypothetical protein [Gemmobacter sp. 24YEA27]
MINRRSLLAALGSGTALALIGARSALADGKVVNFISWGGTTQAAQEEAWIGPFTEATGIKVAPAALGLRQAAGDGRGRQCHLGRG